MHEQKTLK